MGFPILRNDGIRRINDINAGDVRNDPPEVLVDDAWIDIRRLGNAIEIRLWNIDRMSRMLHFRGRRYWPSMLNPVAAVGGGYCKNR